MITNDMPRANISFSLTGEYFDLDQVTKLLNICPTQTRTKEEWPKTIIENANKLPLELRPRTIWILESPYTQTKDINNLCQWLSQQLMEKVAIIKEICAKYQLSVHVEVVIHMEAINGPAIFLDQDSIKFLELINADIGFDLYTY